MTSPAQESPINPFSDDVIREPRAVSYSVERLNKAPLERLLAEFAALDQGDIPRHRPVSASKAQLVVSPDRGYGKSHLLGRLFAALGRRATRIYLRPFQDPGKPWHSILLRTVQELSRPEDETEGTPSQLQALGIGTLAHIVADHAPGNPELKLATPLLRQLASGGLRAADAPTWIGWLSELYSDPAELSRLSNLLSRRHIDLQGREKAWLKIFAASASDDPHGERRNVALKWLRAEPLEEDEIKLLRLELADNEGRGDASAQEINDLSFRRMRGLCQLASYYRPFVFCFDQTEFYASDPALIKALGNTIDQLFAELRNHLTIITANHANWMNDIRPHLATSHRDRFSPPILLEGINKEGARELAEERLRKFAASTTDIARFFDSDWIGQVFSSQQKLGVRAVLGLAAERFSTISGPGAPSPARSSLEDLFQVELNNILTNPALQTYNQDCLMWFVKDIGQAIKGVRVERTSGRKRFSLEWSWPDRCVYFAFENGDHHKTWKSIADEAISIARGHGERPMLAYVFRTPDLEKVPKPTWRAVKPALDEANRLGFRIRELKSEEVCELLAARELYSNALQGNIDYSGPDTLAWLQVRFASFLDELASAVPPLQIEADGPGSSTKPATERPPGSPPAELDDPSLKLVLDVVREHRIIDISAVLAKLGSEALRDPLLRSVKTHPSLKAHPGPKTIFLQWRTTA